MGKSLFDSRGTHSFIVLSVMNALGLIHEVLKSSISINILIRKSLGIKKIGKTCIIRLSY